VRVAVFTGSQNGPSAHREAAASFATDLATAGVGIVYGGGHVGLMGVVADAALAAGGEVVGVIPQHLVDDELAHPRLPRLEIVSSMHERKARMADLADGFLALPGGLGTFEEVFEAMTWTQLGVHDKPVGLVDVSGFWAPAAALLDRALADGFIGEEVRASVVTAPTAAEVLDAFASWRRPALGKWTERPVAL
jgi:uncharacterized protein (TIGR00730 family)